METETTTSRPSCSDSDTRPNNIAIAALWDFGKFAIFCDCVSESVFISTIEVDMNMAVKER